MIESDDFKIDPAERTVNLRGQELRLTLEEFDVPVFLADHPQNVVTPRTLLATSWAARQLRQTEFLEALNLLRNKLHATGPNQLYLQTEPLVLYRFEPTSSSAA